MSVFGGIIGHSLLLRYWEHSKKWRMGKPVWAEIYS